MKAQLKSFFARSLVIPVVLASLATAYAQSDVNVKVNTKNQNQQTPATVTISAEKGGTNKAPNPGVEFTALGGDIARPPVRVPVGGKTLLQVSAPLGVSGSESVLVHVYKLNNALFMNVMTAKGKQVWTRRNVIRLLQPFPAHPETLSVSIRYLEPRKRRGLMIVASEETMHYVLAFPKGLGGKVTQQQFLATSKTGTQSTYQFDDLDGRGFAIVKGTVVGSGEIKAGEAIQYFVWNGSRFVPRAYN